MLTGIRLPAQDFRRIAAGGPSGRSAGVLRAGQDSRRILRVLDAIGGGPPDGTARPEPIDAALRLLDRARAVPGAVRAGLGHPSVGPWALECAHGTAPVEQLASVAAAAGIRAGLEFRLTVPVLPRGVVLPGIGVLHVPTGERTALVEGGPAGWRLTLGPERYAVPTGSPAPGDCAPWLTPATLVLGGPGLPRWAPTAEYADPYLALPPGAPDVHLAPLPRTFRTALARAWELLALRHRDRAEDLAATLDLLVPLRPVSGSYANASRPDAFGAAWLDVTAPPRRLAAALVHELEHARLTALHDLVPLHTADPEARHPVPWRPVPRPVHALLQGLYAHAAVVEFWGIEAGGAQAGRAESQDAALGTGDEEARREFERYRGNARRALDGYTDRDSLTPAGRELVAALEARIGASAAELTAGQVTVSPSKQKSRPRRTPSGLEEATVEVEQAPSPAAAPRPETPAGGSTAIVYASMDSMWAEWIREQYERAGYATVLERYSSSATRTLAEQLNHGLERHARLVVLFSAPFMVAVSGSPEQWTEAIAVAGSATERVVPVLVGRCKLPAGFWQVTPVNLFGVEQERLAQHRLLRRTDGLEEAHEAALNLTDGQSVQADGSFVRYPGRAPEVINGMPARNTQFTGRREHLVKVREGLTANRVTLVPHTLWGLGGVGKTEIAKEYAHRFGADYDLIWWIRSESRATARASIAELGVLLGADPEASKGECIRYAHDALRRGEPYSRWLLVFDNADDVKDALALLPESTATGHVLITSRNPDWREHGESVPVEVYPRQESVEFLRRKVPNISAENADGFAAAVQDLPLALEHAASWYRETGRSAEEYLELMDTGFRSLFPNKQFYPILSLGTDGPADEDDPIEPDADYVKTVASAWLIASQTMASDQRNPAIKLLELLSFFAPTPVPLDLVRSVPTGLLPRDLELCLNDEQSTRDMIRAISTRSLAKAYSPAEGAERHALEMHRVVQLFTANGMSAERIDQYRRAARMALVASTPGDPEDPANYRAYVEVIPHLRPTWALRGEEPEVRRLVLDTCRSLLRQGEYNSCLTLVHRAMPDWTRTLAADDVDLLTLRRSESLALGGLGDQVGRLSINREVYELAIGTDGEENDVALRARGSIASALLWLGRLVEAEQAARAVLEASKAKHGAEDPITLRETHNYAAHLRLAGRHEEALELDRDVYRRRVAARLEQGVGRPSRDVIKARTSFARDLRELGVAFEAAQEQEENYADCVEVLGQTDPETLRAMVELGVIRRRAGRYEEAYTLGKLALERHAAQLGEDHPDYIQVLTNFAGDCRFIGEIARGRALALEACEKAHRLIPAPNPIRAATATNLAVFLRTEGELEEATRLDTEALEELHAILGEANHYTLACQINLGNDMAAAGNLAEAKRLHEDSWRRLAELRGDDHPHTLLARANLHLVLELLGEIEPSSLDELLADATAGSLTGKTMTLWEREAIAERHWLNCDLNLPMY